MHPENSYQQLTQKEEILKSGNSPIQIPSGPDLSHLQSTYKKLIPLGIVFVVAITTALCSLVSINIAEENILVGNNVPSKTQVPVLERCTSSKPLIASPPALTNIWASLTVAETTNILAWLKAEDRHLNLTDGIASVASDNVVYLVEIYYPPKQAALAYLDSPPNHVPPPERLARVTIHHGAAPDPVVRNYLVGPLPISAKTNINPLTEIYTSSMIPFNARGITEITSLSDFLSKSVAPLSDAMKDLFGGVVQGQRNDTLVAGISGPFGFDGSFRRLWMTWRYNTAGSYLHPINFYQYVDMSGTDPSKWKILKVVYHDQVFPSIDLFLNAYKNGTLIRKPKMNGPATNLSWTQRKRVGNQRDLDHLPGPRSVSFAGLRFRVDESQQYVSWMGWGMYLAFDRDMGLSLWDIRFRGERIIYQLAPQEALAQYAGYDPVQSTTAWLDRFFGMGNLVRDLLPGYDCPQESVYLPATTFSTRASIYRQRAICIFEQDTGKPLSRHFGDAEGEFGAVKGYVLTIRSISTVGNYDYYVEQYLSLVFDYIFHLDGTIEVKLSASGYLQGGYWVPEQQTYGYRIRESSMGNLHDHVINYKVDFDIVGQANSFLKTTTSQEEVNLPWFDDDWGQTVLQQKVIREYIANEDQSRVKYASNFQGGYAIVNQDEPNRWGNPRGYAIHAGYSPIHNTIVGSKRLLNNANWARYNLAVTRRKESEPTSSSMWNLHLPKSPMVDFHNFFDGENITQEDLVAWINLGMHHLPHAEDSPNTKTNIATSSFILTPLNYFDSDVSMESMNAIILTPPNIPGEAYTFDDNGVKQDFTCIPDIPSPFEYFQSPAAMVKGGGGVEFPDDVDDSEARSRSPLDIFNVKVRI